MKLSAVVSDLDGSLLGGSLMGNSLNLISDEDVKTIYTLKQKGVPTFLVTGRPFTFAADIMDQVGLDLPLCGCNGGHIYDYQTGETRYARSISADSAQHIADFLIERHIPFMIYTQHGVVFSARNEGRHPHWAAQNLLFQEKNRFRECFFVEEAFDFEQEPVLKFLLQLHKEDPIVQEMQARFNTGGQLNIVASGSRFLDICDAQANKAEGVRVLAKMYGFDIAHTLAMGDNFNDEGMLRLAGIPVVPQNGEDAMKALAQYITTSNDHSPLTNAIAHLFPGLLD